MKSGAYSFSLRSLLIWMLLFAATLGVIVRVTVWLGLKEHRLVHPDQWPEPLKQAIAKAPLADKNIRVYGMNDFTDIRSLWVIEGRTELSKTLLEKNPLTPTSSSHPMAAKLLAAMPSNLFVPESNQTDWFATPQFGTVHMECRDLFLIAIDRKHDRTIVLYHWMF